MQGIDEAEQHADAAVVKAVETEDAAVELPFQAATSEEVKEAARLAKDELRLAKEKAQEEAREAKKREQEAKQKAKEDELARKAAERAAAKEAKENEKAAASAQLEQTKLLLAQMKSKSRSGSSLAVAAPTGGAPSAAAAAPAAAPVAPAKNSSADMIGRFVAPSGAGPQAGSCYLCE
eukprot:CAMPEP_0177423580 /NCGR_PEP_ID=MMETSP0368-20130122/71981_1 /TAXON_ID=447022 ORGANISM="Scrippsiella hangoei-like, Strain SHHI-4" /NCGR_SAMPLE_ID=MMETSP0368 /ASSEMBLY_ACC=CAM_ASM_000363 /LENGTH=177 /DNA_ID=CAMNT_0018893681 /DNA_START=9 /DNA_END=539 /DNA_ORIENTATION=+